jgi:hypothetical protein
MTAGYVYVGPIAGSFAGARNDSRLRLTAAREALERIVIPQMSARRLAETRPAQGFLGGTVAVVVERVTVGDVVAVAERAIVDGGGTGLVCSDGCCGL